MSQKQNLANLIRQFLRGKHILIVESSKSFTNMIIQSFSRFGVPSKYFHVAKNFRLADNEMNNSPQIIISEYQIDDRTGIPLAQKQATLFPFQIDRVFIMISSNNSETAIAEVNDEEIDGFLLKPFSPEQFSKVLLECLVRKIRPSAYQRNLEEGKKYFLRQDYNRAEEYLKIAVEKGKKPTMAHYYLGMVAKAKGLTEEAKSEFLKGLETNPTSMKCQRARFDLLVEEKNYQAAHEIGLKLFESYPMSTQMLGHLFMLAAQAQDETAINNYFERYSKFEVRPPELVEKVRDAMAVAGRFCLEANRPEKALEYYKKALVLSEREIEYFELAVNAFVEFDQPRMAEQILKTFPADLLNSAKYAELDFKVSTKSLEEGRVIGLGRTIMEKEKGSVTFFKDFIDYLKAHNRDRLLDNVQDEFQRLYPDQFLEFIGKKPPESGSGDKVTETSLSVDSSQNKAS